MQMIMDLMMAGNEKRVKHPVNDQAMNQENSLSFKSTFKRTRHESGRYAWSISLTHSCKVWIAVNTKIEVKERRRSRQSKCVTHSMKVTAREAEKEQTRKSIMLFMSCSWVASPCFSGIPSLLLSFFSLSVCLSYYSPSSFFSLILFPKQQDSLLPTYDKQDKLFLTSHSLKVCRVNHHNVHHAPQGIQRQTEVYEKIEVQKAFLREQRKKESKTFRETWCLSREGWRMSLLLFPDGLFLYLTVTFLFCLPKEMKRHTLMSSVLSLEVRQLRGRNKDKKDLSWDAQQNLSFVSDMKVKGVTNQTEEVLESRGKNTRLQFVLFFHWLTSLIQCLSKSWVILLSQLKRDILSTHDIWASFFSSYFAWSSCFTSSYRWQVISKLSCESNRRRQLNRM